MFLKPRHEAVFTVLRADSKALSIQPFARWSSVQQIWKFLSLTTRDHRNFCLTRCAIGRGQLLYTKQMAIDTFSQLIRHSTWAW